VKHGAIAGGLQWEILMTLAAEHLPDASDATYRAIFDLANDAIFVHDAATGAIVDVNRKMTEMYGYSREEACRLTVVDLSVGTPPFTQERALEFLRAAAAGTPQLFEWHAKDRRGRPFWVEVNLKHVEIGGRDRLLAIVRDVTERKRTEDTLRAADEQLREQAALVRLGEMAAVVAHEVRNPLAGVRGAIQVISRRLPQQSPDAAVMREAIARLDALDDLMTDLLLFARPPQVRLVPVDIVALANESTDFVARGSTARGVQFSVEGASPPIMADPKLLKSVLLNLLLNATHAVQNAGSVRTSIATTGSACVLAVVDSGPGIPPDIRERIFVPFFTTKSRGTGLGLPTAKRLIEAHRGRIVVDCPSEGGTVVSIELPFTQG
jgi:two-component system, cell cycle sensor histidine kinase and response regulator CckA